MAAASSPLRKAGRKREERSVCQGSKRVPGGTQTRTSGGFQTRPPPAREAGRGRVWLSGLCRERRGRFGLAQEGRGWCGGTLAGRKREAKVSNGQSVQRVRARRAFCLCCGVRAEAVGMA